MDEELNKKFIDEQLRSNAGPMKTATISDLLNKNSEANKVNVTPREATPIPEKVRFDENGMPNVDPLRTYGSDITDAKKREEISISKMMSESQARSGVVGGTLGQNRSGGMRFFLISLVVIMIVGGGSAVVYSYIQKQKALAPVVIAPTEKEIISYENKVIVPIDGLSGDGLIGEIKAKMANAPTDGLRKVALTKHINGVDANIKISEFLNLLNSNIPDKLLRNLYDEFFFGVKFNQNISPFLIMFSSSYDIAYDGLLTWEPDLRDIYQTVTGKGDLPPGTYSFKDRVIQNQDVRALQDEAGNIAFFYAILDQNAIVFAKDAETFKEVLDRLRVSKLKQ